jgi:hypothetical protein
VNIESSNDDSDEEDRREDRVQAAQAEHDSGSNDHVKVIGPEVVKDKHEMLKQDHAAKAEATPLPREMSKKKSEMSSEKEEVESPIQVDEPESTLQPGEEDDEVLKIPGSFDLSGPLQAQRPGATWIDLLRRLTN